MPTILSLSSQVAYGHIGHSAAVLAWQRMGLEVIHLPTILLSNRPDYARHARQSIPAEKLDDMLAAIEANGWLADVDAVFTGYMPSAAHTRMAADWIVKLRAAKPGLFYCCDPILGDAPTGLYIAEDAAKTLRDVLIPLADLITPNYFELGWLYGDGGKITAESLLAAAPLAPMVLATSFPGATTKELTNMLVSEQGAWLASVVKRDSVPHGTGDFLAALLLGHLQHMRPAAEAFALSLAGLEYVIDASQGVGELNLIHSQESWANPAPWPVHPLKATTR